MAQPSNELPWLYIIYENEDGKCVHPADDPATDDCGKEVGRYYE